MQILCDKPNELQMALETNNYQGVSVHYSPKLDIFTSKNAMLRTLKGLFVSSDVLNNPNIKNILDYIFNISKPAQLEEPKNYTCYNLEDFITFCKKFIFGKNEILRIAYDVETTAAPFLSKNYHLAGFSLATTSKAGCYVVLDSIDYKNADTKEILAMLKNILEENEILVFNLQHEYIATKLCVKTDLSKNKHLVQDSYSYALTLKTESFKPDIFKLKLLCSRLLGIENWSAIIDDYIEIAKQIGTQIKRNEKGVLDLDDLTDFQHSLISSYKGLLINYSYKIEEIDKFIEIIVDSYEDWKDQTVIPYSLIPSRMIADYGCYDACYLILLQEYFETWANELETNLNNTTDIICKADIKTVYQETVKSQIMSGILTLNGIFISEKRDTEVKQKSTILSTNYYDKLWGIKSDITNNIILQEFAIEKYKDTLRKKYILPNYIEKLIPDGFKFISTTPTLYSFLCEIDPDNAEAVNLVKTEKLTEQKPGNRYKLLQKHLKPYDSIFEDEIKVLNSDEIIGKFLVENNLMKSVFKPMSGPIELFNILNKEFVNSNFMERVILFEYNNLPAKLKEPLIDKFLEEELLYDFDINPDRYISIANAIRVKVLKHLSRFYPYKEIWEKLVYNGITSFATPIISYIFNVYTATGCTIENPKFAVFDFINNLKICRKFLRINSTFIKGASGGYSSQVRVLNDSILNNENLILDSQTVLDEYGEVEYKNDMSNVTFSRWYANCADTGRWQATIHNVPAGPYCKRRFISRFENGVIMASDMSQMEVRELAVLSNCKKLIEAIKDPTLDIHRKTASLAFNVEYDEVSGAQRKQTKEGIFSIVYGREQDSLAQMLFKGDKKAAERLMDAIFKAYPEIPEYLDNALVVAKATGYVITRRGAPIFLNPYDNKGNDDADAFRRTVQNYAIQGGASIICSNVLWNLQQIFDELKLKSKIICYIHDSIEVDVHPNEIRQVYEILKYCFNEQSTKLYNIPTKGDIVIGISMGEEIEMHEQEDGNFTLEGNYEDVIELCNTLKKITNNYMFEEIEKGEIIHNTDLSYLFQPRAEFVWNEYLQSYKCKVSI